MSMDKPLTPLAAAFNYSQHDLRLNREGQLSGAQSRRLWLRFWSALFGGLLLMIVPVLLAWGLLLWASDQNFSAVVQDQRALIGYLMGLVLGIIYVIASADSLILPVDLLRGQIVMLDAPAQVWGRYLVLKNYRLVLDDAALEMMKTGLHYRAFVLPYSRTLLSIEFSE